MEDKIRIDDTFGDLASYLDMLKTKSDIMPDDQKMLVICQIEKKIDMVEDYVRKCRRDIETASWESDPGKRDYLLHKVCLNMEFLEKNVIKKSDD